MEARRDQQPNQVGVGPSLARTVAAVGTLPAFIFGAAIDGIVGAALGLVAWGVLCALATGGNRLRVRRRQAGTGSVSTSTTDITSEAALFEQLRREPCAICGAPTLLEACLDCSEGSSYPYQRRRGDAAPRDEPDDPAR